ncbi:MAG TPA: hypothetical protein VE999_20500 [Gemmataceae bacterium]|nr:hypothetical protein [Gemmataceae bacterium]
MEPTQELVDSIYRERVLRARRTPLEEKLLLGPQLFEEVCGRMADGIRYQYPDADEQRVQEILQARLALYQRLRKS